MTEADEALVYSYYQPGTSDFRTEGKYDCGKTYGNMIAQRIVDMYRMIKSNGKMDLASCTPENLRDFYYGKPKGTAVVTGRPDLNDWLEHALNPRSKYSSLNKGEQNVLMPKAINQQQPSYKSIKFLKQYEEVDDDYRHDGNDSLHDGS